MEQVKVSFDGQTFFLTYNPMTEYYEAELTAPETTGLHILEVEYISSSGEIATATEDLIVLFNQPPETVNDENIAYFLNRQTLEILDVEQINVDQINRDLETNGNSIFASPRKIELEEDDIIYFKKNDKLNFLGIIKEIQKNDKESKFQITCKDILAMFDFTSFVSGENIIKNTGIEDFITNRIKEEFITNTDTLMNKPYLEVKALTHNPKNISISSLVTLSDNTYNFLTFLNNAIENYELKLSFEIESNKLTLNISTRNEEKILIDTTVSDVSNYEETFSMSYTAKVEVANETNSNIYTLYLLADRTTTTNKNDPNRVYGKTVRKTVKNSTDASQSALDVFKGNSYSHNITFKIYKNSILYDVSKLDLGTPIQIKTKTNIIRDTYISKIQDDDSDFISFTCGNLRVDFIDKLLKERRT